MEAADLPKQAIPAAAEDVGRIRVALDRVLLSDGFASSPQLSRFLRYVVESSLKYQEGAGVETGVLKESAIGNAVFNRGAGYDPKVDPIVRVEARRLRLRLESYYQGPGRTDPVRISLPKGGYSPAFEWEDRPIPLSPDPEIVVYPDGETARFSWKIPILIASVSAAALLIILAVAYWRTSPDRIVENFWNSILQRVLPVLVIPADSGLVILQDFAHRPVTLADYIAGDYRSILLTQSGQNSTMAAALAARRYTSIADLEFTSRLAALPEARKLGIRTRFAREVRPEDLKNTNLILLGARQSNPWVELFEKNATLRLGHDEGTGSFHVINTSPLPGEQREIEISSSDLRREIYGIITFHRNAEGTRDVLVIAGASLAGTAAAADLLLDRTRILPWLTKAESNGRFRGFDILLRDRNLGGSASRAEVVAFHLEK